MPNDQKVVLICGSGNQHKIEEFRQIMPPNYEVLGLTDINFEDDLPETHETFQENAMEKARALKSSRGIDCFAEDSGLEVDAIGGEPGVYSARYAGNQKDHDDNIDLVLSKMQGIENRSARFRSVIALILDGEEHLFEGTVEGEIMELRQGTGGFGYDPIFKPNGYDSSFGVLSEDVKNQISHRAESTAKLIEFLQSR